MISYLRNKVKLSGNKTDQETGASDLVVTLFMIPLFVAILFAIVDVSTYFQTKTQVQNFTRDGARMVALLGGSESSIPLNREKFGGTGVNVASYVREKLVDGEGNCKISGCSAPPVVTCTPGIARNLNDDAVCTVTYYYRGVGGQLTEMLGFGAITGNTIVASESFKVETSW